MSDESTGTAAQGASDEPKSAAARLFDIRLLIGGLFSAIYLRLIRLEDQ